MHTSTIVGDGLVIFGGITLHMSGVDSGKKFSVFDHVYILTGMQLLTHPTWRAEDGTNGTLSLPGDARKKFSLTYPERVHPKKKLAAEIVKQTATDPTPSIDARVDTSAPVDEHVTSGVKIVQQVDEKPIFPTSALQKKSKKAAPAKKESEKGRKQKPVAAQKNETAPKPVDSSSKKGTTKETTTDTSGRGVAASSHSKPPQIPLPSVKLAPPDDVDEDEPAQAMETDAPVNVTRDASPPSPPVAEGSTLAPPGVKPTSTKTSHDDADYGKSTPSPPGIPSPTAKQATKEKEDLRPPLAGVRLAPLHEDDWEDMDMIERAPSLNTSSDQEYAAEVNPYEWVTSEDSKYNILRNTETGVEIRRIPIPESMREEEAERLSKKKNVPTVSTQPPAQITPVAAKKPVDDMTDLERVSIAKKLFATLEMTNFPERYASLDPVRRAHELEIAWEELAHEERTEWMDMTRGPPSSQKRVQAAREKVQNREAENPMIGTYASGIVTGVFDHGYFATLRLEDDEQPRDYRAVLFPVKAREPTADAERARRAAMLD